MKDARGAPGPPAADGAKAAIFAFDKVGSANEIDLGGDV